MNQMIFEYSKRFQFLCNYDPARPVGYKDGLIEHKRVFTHGILQEMKMGKIGDKDPIFKELGSVKDILLTEGFENFSEFMRNLETDKMSLKRSDNFIRIAYNGFVSGTPQDWGLIDPGEYLRCLEQYTGMKKEYGAHDDYWQPRILNWISMIKGNIAQLAANSYLIHGPTLKTYEMSHNGENYHARLWYNLTGDEQILEKESTPNNNRTLSKYVIDYGRYIGTSYEKSFETDSALNSLFNLVANIDRCGSNIQQMIFALDKVKNFCHNRGTLAHIFMKGGNEACSAVTNS